MLRARTASSLAVIVVQHANWHRRLIVALELARHDGAEMLCVGQIALGRRPKQPPIPAMDRDDRLAKIVDFADSLEPNQALDPSLQVGSDPGGLGLSIESESPIGPISVLVVPLREQRVRPAAGRRACGPGLP